MTEAELAACLASAGIGGGFVGWLLRGRRLSRVLPGSVRARREEVGTASVSLEEVLDLLPDAAVLLDGHGAKRFANAEARDAFGDALGTIMRYPAVFSALSQLDGVTVQARAEFVLEVPVRRVVRVDLRLLPEMLAAGPIRVLAILSDQSERDAVERMRADFVAYASHELRTPLATLIGFIETLRGPAADDSVAQREFLGIMATQAGRMQRLIEQLLELSRAEMLEHRRPRGLVNAHSTIERVTEEMEGLCAERDVDLVVASSEEVYVPGDEEQIVRVLVNLVENAVKYAPVEGRRIRIAIHVEQRVLRGRPGVTLTVADNGAGIDAQHLPRLTERFYRVEGRRGAASGYGLGLALVRHIVDRHDGSFEIFSELGKGTQCDVWLPLGQPVRNGAAALS